MLCVRVCKFGGPELLQLDTVPIPIPHPGTFRVKIKTAGLNLIETYILEGKFSKLPKLPYIPGKDFSGIIDAFSSEFENNEKFRIGTRVFGMLCQSMGTYSDFCIVDPTADCVEVLPNHVDFDSGAAATTTYLTAYRALFQKANCKPNSVILIHGGSGNVGTTAIEMAKHRGANVLATADTDNEILIVKTFGVTEGYENEILDFTQGNGVDMILESKAHFNLDRDLRLLKKHGIVLIVGSSDSTEINPINYKGKEITIQGVNVYYSTRSEFQEALTYIQAGLASKALNPFIQAFGIEEICTAHKELITRSSQEAADHIVLKIS